MAWNSNNMGGSSVYVVTPPENFADGLATTPNLTPEAGSATNLLADILAGIEALSISGGTVSPQTLADGAATAPSGAAATGSELKLLADMLTQMTATVTKLNGTINVSGAGSSAQTFADGTGLAPGTAAAANSVAKILADILAKLNASIAVTGGGPSAQTIADGSGLAPGSAAAANSVAKILADVLAKLTSGAALDTTTINAIKPQTTQPVSIASLPAVSFAANSEVIARDRNLTWDDPLLVNVASVPGQLLAADATRKFVLIYNHRTETQFCKFGTAGSPSLANGYSFPVGPASGTGTALVPNSAELYDGDAQQAIRIGGNADTYVVLIGR